MTPDQSTHHRRSIRLRDYDYTQAGAYFVTIVTQDRECLFGDVVDDEMQMNAIGGIVVECWEELPAHFSNVELDAFVLMPNHIHGVVAIIDGPPGIDPDVGAQHIEDPGNRGCAQAGKAMRIGAQHAAPVQANIKPGSLGSIIRSFKSSATKRINEARHTPGASVWHRNYYEHVIRGEKSLKAIREYVSGNPANWGKDEENPANC